MMIWGLLEPKSPGFPKMIAEMSTLAFFHGDKIRANPLISKE
jgi:hypothetical protein